MPATADSLTLTRRELYELVWSKPLIELAQDLGLSDVGLAKRCRKLGVPVPGRGYWARVAAGQTPRQAPLKERPDELADYYSLRFAAPEESLEETKPPDTSAQHAELRGRIAALPVANIDNLCLSSPAIKRTAVHLKRPWRQDIIWSRGERAGPMLRIEVSEEIADRALRLGEHLLSATDALGWGFKPPDLPSDSGLGHRPYPAQHEPRTAGPTYGQLEVEGERLDIRVDERRKQVKHVFTEEEKRRQQRGEYVRAARELVPAGELRLHANRASNSYASLTWKESGRATLESQLKAILSALLDEAIKIKADREQRQRDEIKRRKEEELRWEQTQRRDANLKLIHELEAQAGAWFRARILRFYLRALRREVGTTLLKAKLGEERVDFLNWAEHYVDQLNPLSVTPHDPDLMSDRTTYQQAQEELEGTVGRLVGLRWDRTWKLTGTGQPLLSGDEESTDAVAVDDES